MSIIFIYMMEGPLFSVLCTNYNNGEFIPEMINSLIQQTYAHWELVFVDDGSSDNSLERIEDFRSDSRVRVYSSPTNIGAGGAATIAAEQAKGSLMGRLDADDALRPNAIAIMVKAHTRHPGASLITSQVIACDPQLQPVTPAWHKNMPLPEGKSIIEHPSVGHFATFKTSSYKQTTGFNPGLKRAVDLDIYIKLEEVGPVVVLDCQLYLYRQNINGISQGHNGTLAKALAYQVMIEAYFRRKSSAFKPNISRKDARAMRMRQHQIDISQSLPLAAPWKLFFSTIESFPELLIDPTMLRNTVSATLRNIRIFKI